jgi:hypothetical protein
MYHRIFTLKFDVPCMCGVDISWWMVARFKEQLSTTATKLR